MPIPPDTHATSTTTQTPLEQRDLADKVHDEDEQMEDQEGLVFKKKRQDALQKAHSSKTPRTGRIADARCQQR